MIPLTELLDAIPKGELRDCMKHAFEGVETDNETAFLSVLDAVKFLLKKNADPFVLWIGVKNSLERKPMDIRAVKYNGYIKGYNLAKETFKEADNG